MAVIYLRSTDGSDASDGLTWANAKATLAAALTAAGAGGTVYVSASHAETQGSTMTATSPGTAASPVQVVCVNDTGDPEPPTARATTATVTVTGASNLNLNGTAYYYGITFECRNILPLQSGSGTLVFEACNLKVNQSGSAIICGTGASSTSSRVVLINTVCHFTATNQEIQAWCEMEWWNTASAIGGSTLPTTLFDLFGPHGLTCVGVDLSALGSGKTLCDLARATGRATFVDCKLGSSVAVATGTITGQGGATALLVNCDSSDTNYRFARHRYEATETQETTIVRSGGASDGTTTFSRKIVTTANSSAHFPYRALPIEFWQESVGSAVTVTIPVVTDNVTLTDAEAWIEVEYLGTSGFPLGSFVSDRVSDPIFGTPANQTTDGSSSWTTTGLGTPVKQSLSVTFTPQEKGIVRVYVCVAKVSTTVYYDPKVQIS